MADNLPIDMGEMRTYRSELKQRQWLSARLLLHDMFPGAGRILYDEIGAPHLDSGRKISISHSDQMVAILLGGGKEVGVDIQHFSNRIGRVKEKFCSAYELEFSKGDQENEVLHVIWCSKEAVYKKLKAPGLIFSTEIAIPKFELSNNDAFNASAKHGGMEIQIPLQYEILGEYTLVYTSIT